MKTRRYKVTMYVDVPLFLKAVHIKDEDDMEKYLADKLGNDGIYGDFEVSKAPITDEINGELHLEAEDITDFECPVGFIAPDGLFYGVEEDIDPLVHIRLAGELYDYYKDIYPERHSNLGTDVSLELMGFIKIHGGICRYYTEPRHLVYWTDEQRKTVYKWMKHTEKKYAMYHYTCLFDGIGPNSRHIHSAEFQQMDKFAIMSCFACLK